MTIDQNTPTFRMEAYQGAVYEYAFISDEQGNPELICRDDDGVLKRFEDTEFALEFPPSTNGFIKIGVFPPASLRLLADKLEEFLVQEAK